MQPSSAVVQMPSAQLQLSSTARFSATEFAARASSVCSAQPSPTGCSPSQRQLNCCQLRPSSTLWRGSFQPSSQREPTYFAQAGLVQPGATQLRCCSPPASSAPAQQPRSTRLNGSSTEVSSTLRLCLVQPSSQLEPAQFAQLSLVQHGAAQLSGCSTAISSAPTQLSGAVQSNRVHNSSQLSLLRSA